MATATRCLLVGGCVAALLLWRQRRAVRFARANLLRCSMCGTLRAPIEFTPRQARRDGTMRKCRPCVAMYVETPRSAADKEARKAARALERSQALAAAEAARDAVSAAQEAAADRIEDPLRLASKAETVLRGRSDRVLLVLENCSDDLNHVAVLRTAEALGVLRVWLVQRLSAPLPADTRPSPAPPDATTAGEAVERAQRLSQRANSRATRRLQARAAQRGLDCSSLLGSRQAKVYASHLDIRVFTSSAECIDAVRADGRALWVTDLSQEALPLTSDVAALRRALPPRLAIVIGSEGVGVSKVMVDAADVRVFLPMWGFTESFNISVATALVLQRLLDAMPDSRGALPPEEMQRLRTEWYDALARTEEQRAAFARLAERGGARPLRDTRRPEAHRDEQRGRTGEKRRLWSRGVGAE